MRMSAVKDSAEIPQSQPDDAAEGKVGENVASDDKRPKPLAVEILQPSDICDDPNKILIDNSDSFDERHRLNIEHGKNGDFL